MIGTTIPSPSTSRGRSSVCSVTTPDDVRTPPTEPSDGLSESESGTLSGVVTLVQHATGWIISHHGKWATTRAGAVTLVQHASGWLIAHTDGESHAEVITPGEDSYWCDWSPVDGITQVPDLMAALVEWVAEYAKPLGLPGLDPREPEPDEILRLDDGVDEPDTGNRTCTGMPSGPSIFPRGDPL